MADIYKLAPLQPEEAEVLKEMTEMLAEQFGVAVTGNRCTLRWDMRGELVDVHMVILELRTPSEVRAAGANEPSK